MQFLKWKMEHTVFEADSLGPHYFRCCDIVCTSTERLLSISEIVWAEALRATSSVYIYLVANVEGKSESIDIV